MKQRTPETTIEAIKLSVRFRGAGALDEPATRERLSRCDPGALTAINGWLIDKGHLK